MCKLILHATNLDFLLTSWKSGTGFQNDLRETLTYGELLKYKFYQIAKIFERVSYFNNFIKCLYNSPRCPLIHNLLEFGSKTCVSKVYRKIRALVSRSRIRPQQPSPPRHYYFTKKKLFSNKTIKNAMQDSYTFSLYSGYPSMYTARIFEG